MIIVCMEPESSRRTVGEQSEAISKPRIRFESKAQTDEKAQHTREYVSILKKLATQLSGLRRGFEMASKIFSATGSDFLLRNRWLNRIQVPFHSIERPCQFSPFPGNWTQYWHNRWLTSD